MNPGTIPDAVQSALLLIILLSAPVALIAGVVSLVVGAAQSATQWRDQSISSIPRIIAVWATITLLASIGFEQVLKFSQQMYHALPAVQNAASADASAPPRLIERPENPTSPSP